MHRDDDGYMATMLISHHADEIYPPDNAKQRTSQTTFSLLHEGSWWLSSTTAVEFTAW
jgi:hypothetical protein